MSRAEKIIWTTDEQDKLFRVAKEMWEVAGGKDKSLIELVRLAQIHLPENRRRKHLQGPSQVPKPLLKRLLDAKIGKLRSTFKLEPEALSKDQLRIQQLGEERDQALEQVRTQQGMIEELQARVRQFEKMPPPPTELEVIAGFIAGIAAQVVEKTKAKAELQTALAKEQAEGNGQPRPRHQQEMPPEGKRLPKVAILGGHENLHVDLHEEFHEMLDLRYFPAGTKERVARSDFSAIPDILVFTKYIGHDMIDALKPSDRAKIVRLNTREEVREKLTEIAVRG